MCGKVEKRRCKPIKNCGYGYLILLTGINNKTMASIKILGKRKKIALVAHDHKKADLMEWAIYNKTSLAKHELFAPGTHGRFLERGLARRGKKF